MLRVTTISRHVDRGSGSGGTTQGRFVARVVQLAALLCLIPVATFAQLPFSPDWIAADGDRHDNFGNDVNAAGDVNGDGYSDVIVSCPGLDGDNGGAFVYCGGPNGLTPTHCWLSEGTQPGLQYSNESFGAGDVNGDGYGDVIVGARGYNYVGASSTLEGGVFVFHGSESGLSATPDWEVHGEIEDMELGTTVAAAGDVNGDGYDDVLAAARNSSGTVRLFFGSATGLSSSVDWSVSGYGTVMAGAGDTNGDGFDDVLIGSVGSSRALVFFGSPTGPSTTPDWIGVGPSGELFARAVSTAGDVNGDGYAEILVGAPDYGSQDTGRVWIYFGSANGPAASADFAPAISTIGAEFGIDVQTAGDVNADGFADILVGAHYFSGTEGHQGRVYLYLGSSGGLGNDFVWAFDGEDSNDYMGRALSGAGDINADGYSDVILGAPGATLTDFNEGVAYAFYGSGSPLLSSDPYAIRVTNQDSAQLGFPVAYAGDLNGDGLGDVAAGAVLYDFDHVDGGSIIVWHGTPTGGGIIDYAAQRYGTQSLGYFGASIARAGDVNGDGYDDLLASEPLRDGTHAGEGAAFVYHGSETGIPSMPNWTTTGNSPSAFYGFPVAGAGDVNGDGFADALVGGPGHSNTLDLQGEARLFFGSETGLSTSADWSIEGESESDRLGQGLAGVGDVNGDGFSDIAVSAPYYDHVLPNDGAVFVYHGSSSGPSLTPDWMVGGEQEGAALTNVAAAGDINGDGYADVLIGNQFWDAGPTQVGKVDLYYGSPSGLSSTSAWTIVGTFNGGWLGRSVSTAGDVNRDGYSDIIVTEENYDDTYLNQGAVYIYLGGPSGLTFGSFHTSDQENTSYGNSASTAGDLNGDGYADVIVGATGYDFSHDNAGAMFVYLGNDDVVGGGHDIRPQQKRTDGTPITLLGMSNSSSEFVVAARGRCAMGRTRVRAEWQVAELGTSLDGRPVETGFWTDSGVPDSEGSVASIEESVFGLIAQTQYHWRVRTRAHSLYTPITAWATVAPAGASTAHLRTADTSSSVSVEETKLRNSAIQSVTPNPMRASTSVSFRNRMLGAVRVTIHDVSGRRVANIVNDVLPPGDHIAEWNGSDKEGQTVPNGLYLLRVVTPDGVDSEKIWITR